MVFFYFKKRESQTETYKVLFVFAKKTGQLSLVWEKKKAFKSKVMVDFKNIGVGKQK